MWYFPHLGELARKHTSCVFFGIIRGMKVGAVIVAIAISSLTSHLAAAGTGDVLRTIADINAAIEKRIAGATYDVTAKLVLPVKPKLLTFHAADETGCTIFGMDPAIRPTIPTNAGDIVRIKGVIIPTL